MINFEKCLKIFDLYLTEKTLNKKNGFVKKCSFEEIAKFLLRKNFIEGLFFVTKVN